MLKNIFPRKKLVEPIIEIKYLKKYKDSVDLKVLSLLMEKYKSGDVIFEPLRKKLTKVTLEKLYSLIDKSGILSPQEKVEAIFGLMMILDGFFPETYIISHLKKIFGEEFAETVDKKSEELKGDIVVRKLIRFVKSNFGEKNKR
jgi:hypothetical protein